jgi:nucleotide-binding universal stress UspA family protein
MYRHILVPTDGSEVSIRAEKAAIEMAKKFGARITVAHVIAPFSPHAALGEIRAAGTQPLTKEEYEKAAQERGTAAAHRVVTRAQHAKVAADAVLETDDSPGDAIVRIANQSHCDLIVMASHSRVGIERVFIGSVASEVLTGTKTPVLVCH